MLRECSVCKNENVISSLKNLQAILDSKEQDLNLAIEAGQKLLKQNKDLEQECLRLRESKEKQGSNDSHRIHLLDHLQVHVSTLEADILARDETISLLNRKLSDLNEKLVKSCTERDDLIQEKSNWISEKQLMQKDIQILQRNLSDIEQSFAQYRESESRDAAEQCTIIKSHAHKITEISLQLETAKQANQQLLHQVSHVSRLRQDLEAALETAQVAQGSVSSLEDKCVQLQMELEWERSQRKELESRLAVLEPGAFDNNETVKGSKSILGEIEDRRVELQQKHETLSSQHAGLLKAHTISLHYQHKMKNRLARLTVLSGQTCQHNQESLLEDALRRKEDECRELQSRILALERFKNADNYDTNVLDNHSLSFQNKDEHIESLRHQVQQQSFQLQELKDKYQTLELLKVNEFDKNRNLATKLAEKEKALQSLYMSYTQLGNDFDALKEKATNNSQELTPHILMAGRKDEPLDNLDSHQSTNDQGYGDGIEAISSIANAADRFVEKALDEIEYQPKENKELPQVKVEKDKDIFLCDSNISPHPNAAHVIPKRIAVDRNRVDNECNQQ